MSAFHKLGIDLTDDDACDCVAHLKPIAEELGRRLANAHNQEFDRQFFGFPVVMTEGLAKDSGMGGQNYLMPLPKPE